MRIALFTTAALAAALASAPARAGDFDLTIMATGTSVDADADFINADKLDNELSGVFGGIDVGAEYTFGDDGRGFVVGLHYATTLTSGISSEPIRNGNYLIHHTVLDGYSSWDGRIGYDFGRFGLYAGFGQLEREVTTYQSCPEDSDATVAGYCYGGGVLATRNAREGLRGGDPESKNADLIRFGLNIELTDNAYVNLDFAQAEFGQSVTPLGVIGAQPADRVAHGPTSFAQDFNLVTVGIGWRF